MNIAYAPAAAVNDAGTATLDASFGDAVVQLKGQGRSDQVTLSGAKKWNPGHYAQLPVLYNDANIEEISKIPEIKGIMISYQWGNIEKKKGSYDFSRIRHDLDLLKARGKRLVLQIADKTYRSELENACVPPDMRTDSKYLGGQVSITLNTGRRGCIAKRWVPAVMDRLIALHHALGAQFDKEPFVEGIVTEESATSTAFTNGATARSYVDQLKRLGSALSTAYPSTLVAMQLNFRIEPHQAELVDHLYRNGIGFGGPDTSPLVKTSIVPTLSSAYARRTPILMAVNATHLTFYDDPIAEGILTLDDVFDFAVADPAGINANHLFWWFFKKQWNPGVSYDFYDTVALIKRRGGQINTGCPENILCGN